MDSATFFATVTVLVAFILIVIGIYLILLIHEAHQSLKRINRILTRIDYFSTFVENSIARPTAGLANLAGLIHDGVNLINDLRRTVHKKEKDYE